jgi:UDP-GlcNAc:undecaprenyl-phosphate GlcNAc-1-phosphate transferase
MHAIVGLGITAFLLCLVATPLCRDIFQRFNIVDQPDTERKFHLKPIPRIGGIPIVLSYAGALGLMLILAPHDAKISVQHGKLLWSLLPAAGLVFLTGLVDDIIGLKPWQKLSGQAVAAVLAVALGARTSILDGHPLFGWLTIPISVIWLVGCTNAVNLIDGLDGLAAGVGLFATLVTLIAALISGNLGLAMATVPLAGCLLAFLCYNFSPASIFLGDCGSLTIGFMLGCFGLIWSQRTGTLLGMAAPLMALALPLADVGLSICRRFLRSAPIFGADRGHIHHMVLALGFKPRSATLILYGVCGVAALFALLVCFSRFEYFGFILLLFCSLVWIGINCLGYIEFRAARRALSRKMIFRALREEIYLHELNRSLVAAESIEDLWKVVCKTCHDMRFATVRMYLHDRSFVEVFNTSDSDLSWKMTLSLGREGRLVLTRASEDKPPILMISVLNHLQECMTKKEHTLATTPIPSSRTGTHVISGAA